MKTVMVRYKVKPGRIDENRQYIDRVFEALSQSRPEGLRYASFRMPDGVSFVHVASVDTADGTNPLSETPAFQAFTADIRERCDEPPAAVELELVGSYRLVDG
ncbi:MAG: hypothetical protein QF926_05040 [Alphaproteobacteria bacterium]|jgi:hypothetical protein|nr:hypothetical protein [Alphaproteobacteria bacterium]MDP6515976.1 hypothetical protein [Alphaproteobacteria bacterium]